MTKMMMMITLWPPCDYETQYEVLFGWVFMCMYLCVYFRMVVGSSLEGPKPGS